jgi:hypothetical protein
MLIFCRILTKIIHNKYYNLRIFGKTLLNCLKMVVSKVEWIRKVGIRARETNQIIERNILLLK